MKRTLRSYSTLRGLALSSPQPQRNKSEREAVVERPWLQAVCRPRVVEDVNRVTRNWWYQRRSGVVRSDNSALRVSIFLTLSLSLSLSLSFSLSLQVAFITAIPAKVRADAASLPMVEINFLCVHKKLRAKRLAPVLIKEITRRVNLEGVWQAAYTAGVVLPKPLATCRSAPLPVSIGPSKLNGDLNRALESNTTFNWAHLLSPPAPGPSACCSG